MPTPDENREPLAKRVAVAKDLLALLRDGTLVLLFLLLILVPGFIGDRLVSAGFEEGEFVGFKWKKQATVFGQSAQDLYKELTATKATVASLNAQLRENQAELERLRQADLPDDVAERVASLQSDNQRLAVQSANQAKSITNTLNSSRAVVAQARQVTGASGTLAVILGGDSSLDAARDEVRVFTRAGIGNLAVYRRDGSFRTVAITDSRQTADEWLEKARPRRPDVYVVNLASWCPAPRAQTDYFEC